MGERLVQADVSAPARDAMLDRTSDGVRLVLLIVVDQLRRDRFSADLPGGLGRIAREGRVFDDAALAHAVSATCPGHTVLLTGRNPGPAGVPANQFIDRRTGEGHYCVDDPADDARVLGVADAAKAGRSPRNIRVDSLATWLKARDARSRVMSVSGKDRAAIASVGHGADAAWWFQSPVGFTTSRFYLEALPAWVEAWNGEDPSRDGPLSRLPDTWSHIDASPAAYGRLDTMRVEGAARSRVSGHPLRDANRLAFFENVYRSPYLDLLTLDFAAELVTREDLGRGPAPDLLVVSLSANDTIGHTYGPESHEARDALQRLDAEVGRFIENLERRVGSAGLLVVLTADHGVLPIPEWLQATGRGRCPIEGGRIPLTGLGLGPVLDRHFGLPPTKPRPRHWFDYVGGGLTFDRALAKELGLAPGAIAAVAKEHLEGLPYIERAWTDDEIRRGRGEMAALYRNSFDAERSPDLQIQAKEGCLIRTDATGTTHGSPYTYDRAIPLAFMGKGIETGHVSGAAASVDIAPTLARHLGLAIPGALDGRSLSLDPAVDAPGAARASSGGL